MTDDTSPGEQSDESHSNEKTLPDVGRRSLLKTLGVGAAGVGLFDASVQSARAETLTQSQDVGSPGTAGSTNYSDGTYTIEGSGDDIWASSDEFHYAYEQVSGDCTVTARVASVENTNSWAKAGVMVRESLDAGSKHAMTVVTPGNGVSFQRRTTTGGTSGSTTDSGYSAPHYVRVERSGDTLTGYRSSDGSSWTAIDSVTVSMSSDVYVGLPVTSHNDGTLCTAEFDSVWIDSSSGTPTGDGEIIREYWTGVTGTSVADIPTGTSPDGTETLTTSLEGPVDWGDDYGTRIEGYITAPETGEYTFWIASDDNSELHLSTDDTAANASVIASVNDWTSYQEWNKYSSQQSSAVSLQEGQRYYVKVLHKEGTGGDNVSVGWRKPSDGVGSAPAEVVPASQLSPYDSTPTGTGEIGREFWTNVGGTAISNNDWTTAPDQTDTTTAGLQGRRDWGDDYATRIEGTITAPESGDYTFWIAGDDDSDLYLSTDATAGNASKIAEVNGWTNWQEWNKYSTQQSSTISLTAGNEYYVKVLHKEGTGGDHVEVGWRNPSDGSGSSPTEIVPAEQLSPYDGSGGDGGSTNADALIPYASSAPTIDASVDSVWSDATAYDISNNVSGTIDSSSDLAGTWKAMWDESNLYYLVEVSDDTLVTDSSASYDDDSVEIFIDGDNSKNGNYDGANDLQLAFQYDGTTVETGTNSIPVSNVDFATTSTADGWRLEVAVPWSDVNTGPADGKLVGTDVHVNDDDTGGGRDAKIAWYDTADSAWNDPSVFGTAEYGTGHSGDGTAPSAPSNLTDTGKSRTSVDLDWDAASDSESGVSFYRVYVDGIEETETNATSISVSGLSAGTSYDFHVTAVDYAGNESGTSNTVTVTTDGGSNVDLPTQGMGLNGVSYHSKSYQWAEVSGISGEWMSTDGSVWEDDRSIPTDDQGYPTDLASDQSAKALVFTHNDEEYETGQYLLTWDGEGTIELDADRTVIEDGAGDTKDHRRVVEINSTSGVGILLMIHETDPNNTGNNIRNIDLWRPGYWESTQGNRESRFHEHLKNNASPFGPIRFMDWGHTNNSNEQYWSDRAEPGDAFLGDSTGVPYEYMVDLCNEIGEDPWICVPHKATDNYVEQLAQLVSNRLDSGLRVWIEYSNEVWNSQFDQYDYADQQANNTDLNNPEWYGQRSKEIFQIFESVFGGTDRLVRVVAGQAANPWVLENALGQAGTYADVGAIAHYFTRSETADYIANNYDTITLNECFDMIDDDIRYYRDNGWADNKATCDDHGVDLISYEGQQHLVAFLKDNEEQVYQKYLEINRADRMYDTYRFAMDTWRNDVGGATLMPFVEAGGPSKYGYWGHKEIGRLSMGDSQGRTVKYDAVYDWTQDNPL